FNGPLVLASSLPSDGASTAALAQVRRAVSRDPDVAFVSRPELSPRRDAATLTVVPRTSPQDQATTDLVSRLRDDVLPAAARGTQLDVHVGGATAMLQDLADRIAERLPLFIALVVGLS